MLKPSFFVVGAPKCGTTSLCHYLRQHPEIFIPDSKEPNFFASDLDLPRNFRTEAEYLKAFACTNKPHSGEASTWYLYSSTAAREILDFNPNAKIIMSIRNPIEMVYSLFRYRRYTGVERARSFREVLAREKYYFMAYRGRNMIVHTQVYSSAAEYYEQIKRYIDVFGSGNVHVVVLEDLKDNPEEVYGGLLRFLGVRVGFQPVFRHVNRTGRIRSERFQERIAHLPAPLKRLAYAFPRSIRRPAYKTLHRLNTSYAPPPPLDPGLRRRLKDEFRPNIERLSALIGRDLTPWCAE